MIFDEERGKLSFSVPSVKEGRRGGKKKSFGHQMFNIKRNGQEEEESDRQLYTAVTRAKTSLAFLVPDRWGKHAPPWLKRFSFFEKNLYDKEGKLAEGFFTREGSSYHAGTPREPLTPEAPLTQGESLTPAAAAATRLPLTAEEPSASAALLTPSPRKPLSPDPALSPKLLEPAPPRPPLTAARFFNKNAGGQKAWFEDGSEEKKRLLSSTDFIAFSEEEKAFAGQSENANRLNYSKNSVFSSNEAGGGVLKAPSHSASSASADEAAASVAGAAAAGGALAENIAGVRSRSKASLASAFIKAQSGLELHHCLRLLALHPLARVQERVRLSSASEKEERALLKALNYVLNLRDPDLPFFIQNGFAEQEFKLKEGGAVLQGRTDLWGWKGKRIFLFDYKSGGGDGGDGGARGAGGPGSGVSSGGFQQIGFKQEAAVDRFAFAAEKQLAFYSFVLDRLFRPEAVRAFLVFPFQEAVKECPYRPEKTEREISLFLKSRSLF